jgi:hypothetical protein
MSVDLIKRGEKCYQENKPLVLGDMVQIGNNVGILGAWSKTVEPEVYVFALRLANESWTMGMTREDLVHRHGSTTS